MKSKLFFAVLITSLIILPLLTGTAVLAQGNESFAGGSGTPEDPWQIETANHLNNVRDYLDDYFILIDDIDLDQDPYNTGEGWEPIGRFPDGFAGSLDGQGYVIENLFIDSDGADYVGLFGYLDSGGVVKNLGLESVDITGDSLVGSLVGDIFEGSIANSYVTGNVMGSTRVGGLVGGNLVGTVDNSYAASNVMGDHWVGGLVGVNRDGIIEASYAIGDVTGSNWVGGLVGFNERSFYSSEVINSYATGFVSGINNVGGLVGSNTGTVSDSFYDSETTGKLDDTGKGTPKTTAEMQNNTTFSEWNITDVTFGDTNDTYTWNIDNGNTYPFLSWQEGHVRDWHDLHAVRNNLDKSYILVSNLDQNTSGYDYLASNTANGGDGWEPIGTEGSPFTGTFDGGGHTISGLYIYRMDYGSAGINQGLFGYTGEGALIKNLGVTDVNITGSQRTGGLVGSNKGNVEQSYVTGSVNGINNVGGLVGRNDGTVDHCYAEIEMVNFPSALGIGGLVGLNFANDSVRGVVRNSHADGTLTGGLLGGLVGANRGDIEDSYSECTVEAGFTAGDQSAGGLVGITYTGSTITNSYATGDVSGYSYVGGLVGRHYGTMINCHATGDVSGTGKIGGLVGRNDRAGSGGDPGIVTNSYATGAVSGNSRVGGLVGRNIGGTVNNSYASGVVNGDSRVGGLVGENQDFRDDPGIVTNSYSTGQVTGNADVGGLVGVNAGKVNNSFWDTLASGQAESAGGTGKATAEMKLMATFNDWDIALTQTDLNDSYPFLAWQDDRDDVVWLIKEQPLFCGGEGTETDPYLICTADELNNVRYQLDAYFKLNNDIDLDVAPYNEGDGWLPIGGTVDDDPQTPFTGNFDGNGYQITNLFIDRSSDNDIGLFGYTEEAILTDVKLVNVDVTGQSRTGSLVGASIDTKVEDSHVTGVVNGNNTVGGLIGYEARRLIGSIYNSYAGVDVTGNDVVGGLVGTASETTIKDSHASGAVTGNNNVGGLAGYSYDSTIEDCYAAGDVTGNDDVGGLVGRHHHNGEIIGCYAEGNVTGQQNTGGLTGLNQGTITVSYALGNVEVNDPEEFTVQLGGLIGYNMGPVNDSYAMGDVAGGASGDEIGGLAGGNEDTITNSYATGEVTGRDDLGGLVGGQWGTIITSYYDKITTGLGDDAVGDGDDEGITGLATEEMKKRLTFTDAGWDFDDIWWIQEGISYPAHLTNPQVITLSVDPETAGSVQGAGTYQYGQQVTVIAEANPGYSFVNWTEEEQEQSTDSEYTFTITGSRDLVAHFKEEPSRWLNLTAADARALAYDGGVLAASVDGFGIGIYDGNEWVNLTTATAPVLATDGSILAASVEGFGIWAYNGGWSQLTPYTADLLAVDNGMVAASFADHGIWLFDGNEWTNLTSAPARALAFDSGRLVASVDGFGTWLYDEEWQQLTAEIAQIITISDGNIAASFTDFGIWYHDGDDWTNLTPVPARALAFDSGILVASADGFGTWLNDGEWSNIITITADLLTADQGKVAASFEGQGIWLYE